MSRTLSSQKGENSGRVGKQSSLSVVFECSTIGSISHRNEEIS